MHRRGLLLDRDGVINVDHGYVGTLDRFEFKAGIFPFLRAVQDKGFRLAVLTNQSGVARGHYAAKDHEAVTDMMLAAFAKQGIHVDLALVCFEHPEGTVPPYNRDSFWRKPNPGMVLEAVQRLGLDPKRSAFLGDNLRDMQAARAGGVGSCLWLTDKAETLPEGVKLVRDYDEAFAALTSNPSA